ncbi:Metallo-beta-lactamase family protein [Candidatus Rhodobacter oscarellae]|uniref:Metallo-beta-lactamase family protein n=1 Tax=Candidatus Rhodobacter oscarellae TaxID=1675527 RepID=A0A0J9E9F7_9RHOB|nr:Metallo-beta-lactamase family protein [Candidatus Rhodobacter lobularis]
MRIKGQRHPLCDTASSVTTEIRAEAHYGIFTGLPFRLRQKIENHHGALRRLREFLTQPRSAVDCFQPLFLRKIGAGEYGLALVEAVAHLNHLLALGEASRTRLENGAWAWQMREA